MPIGSWGSSDGASQAGKVEVFSEKNASLLRTITSTIAAEALGFDAHTKGDLNCDAAINAFDIEPFLAALFDPDEYRNNWPDCEIGLADINRDGNVNAFDIQPFLEVLFP